MMTNWTILDGGMGRELQRMGAPFRRPEWSAQALLEGPEWVLKAHKDFIEAGAEIITTNSYAVVPFHIGEDRYREKGRELLKLSGELAVQAREQTHSAVKIAASIPPLFGSYRADLFDPSRAEKMLTDFAETLLPRSDIILAETIASWAETESILKVFHGRPQPLWLSFTLQDNPQIPPTLRSGELFTEVLKNLTDFLATQPASNLDALLFNCSQPEVMNAAIVLTKNTEFIPLQNKAVGVYANAFTPIDNNITVSADSQPIRTDLSTAEYLAYAKKWIASGATIIGGCCGVGGKYIRALSEYRETSS